MIFCGCYLQYACFYGNDDFKIVTFNALNFIEC